MVVILVIFYLEECRVFFFSYYNSKSDIFWKDVCYLFGIIMCCFYKSCLIIKFLRMDEDYVFS